MIKNSSKYLLFIEPNSTEKLSVPFDDKLVELMKHALSKAKIGTAHYSNGELFFRENSSYKGFHSTDCNESSDNKDYLLENKMITNSLCVFYLQYYRYSISETEMNKIIELAEFYKDIFK